MTRSVWKGPFVHPSLLKKIDKLKNEFNVLEQYIVSLAHQFTAGVENIQEDNPEIIEKEQPIESKERIKPTKRRRKRGTELTLDD